jgi:enterochelin esterase-like enzyme
MLIATLSLALAQASPARAEREPIGDRCTSAAASIDIPCTLPLHVSPAVAGALLAERDWIWWVAGDTLTMIARKRGGELGSLCCAIQFPVEAIPGSDLVGIAVRVPRIDEALLDVAFLRQGMNRPPEVYRGIRAPAAPRRAEPRQGRITEHKIDSLVLGESRWISVYIPPDVPEGTSLPVVYLADNATWAYAPLLEAAVKDGRAKPAIIVGISHRSGPATGCAQPGHCDGRNLEYLPHFSAEGSGPNSPFGRHLRFVSDEVIPLIERTYPASARREHRIAAGFSSGAVWAVSAAARRPDLFGNVLGMSPGGQGSVGDAALLKDVRVYLGAGLFEPTFLRATRERAELAKRIGADVRYREMISGHTHAMWEILFVEGLTWLLPQR